VPPVHEAQSPVAGLQVVLCELQLHGAQEPPLSALPKYEAAQV
jgi:hypothetical protein